MGQSKILAGIIAIVICLIFLAFGLYIPATAFILIGIAFIIFHSDEEKVEQRKDAHLNKRKTK